MRDLWASKKDVAIIGAGGVLSVLGVILSFAAGSDSQWPTIGSLLVGIGITLIFTHAYYVFSSRSFEREAQTLRVASTKAADAGAALLSETGQLRRLSVLTLRAMEEAGLVDFGRDDDGNITGLIIKFAGSTVGTGGGKGNLTVDATVMDATGTEKQ